MSYQKYYVKDVKEKSSEKSVIFNSFSQATEKTIYIYIRRFFLFTIN